jgi:hypothetical protein
MATSVSSAVVERSHTGRERQRRERGGDDEWPRFDVDAKQARFGVWLLRAGSRCGGRAFRVLVALAGVVSLLVGVRDRFACIVMCGLVAALDADTDHERRSRDDEEPGEQRAGAHQHLPLLRLRRCTANPTRAARMTAHAMPSQPSTTLPATAPTTAGPTAQHRTISRPPPTSAKFEPRPGLARVLIQAAWGW